MSVMLNDMVGMLNLAVEDAKELPIGERAKFGLLLKAAGDALCDSARQAAFEFVGPGQFHRWEYPSGPVIFRWRAPQQRTSVSSVKVREQYPPEERPDLYTTSNVKETIAIFEVKDVPKSS